MILDNEIPVSNALYYTKCTNMELQLYHNVDPFKVYHLININHIYFIVYN